MLDFHSVSVSMDAHTASPHARTFILQNIHAQIPNHTITMLIGANGAGKTTLLRAACGLQPISQGEIIWHDAANMAQLSVTERARRLAWVPQEDTQAFDYLVQDIVCLGRFASHQGSPGKLDWQHTTAALATLNCQTLAHRPYKELSSGERRKVQIARGLASDAPLLILDEPCAHLDIKAALELLQLLKQLCRTGATKEQRTILLSIHDIELARRFADHVICLKQGRVIAAGDPKSVLSAEPIREAFGVETALASTLDGRQTLFIDLPT